VLGYVGQDQPVELSSTSWSIGRWALFAPLPRGGPSRCPGEPRPFGTLPYCTLTIGLAAACEAPRPVGLAWMNGRTARRRWVTVRY
jgi:hypothetical protein